MNLKTRLLILIGNLAPVLLALATVPATLQRLPEGLAPDAVFAHAMLAALPALLVAAVGALMSLVGGISILIDWQKSEQPMPFTHKLWLLAAAILPCAFAVLFFIGVFKQNF